MWTLIDNKMAPLQKSRKREICLGPDHIGEVRQHEERLPLLLNRVAKVVELRHGRGSRH